MNADEKARKYDEIVAYLWQCVVQGNLLQSTVAAALIHHLQLVGPNGEQPDEV